MSFSLDQNDMARICRCQTIPLWSSTRPESLQSITKGRLVDQIEKCSVAILRVIVICTR